jgi:hypothetical protein
MSSLILERDSPEIGHLLGGLGICFQTGCAPLWAVGFSGCWSGSVAMPNESTRADFGQGTSAVSDLSPSAQG